MTKVYVLKHTYLAFCSSKGILYVCLINEVSNKTPSPLLKQLVTVAVTCEYRYIENSYVSCTKILVVTRTSVALVAFFGKKGIPERRSAFDLGVVFNI
jgi:hypothetical protein